MGDFKDLYKLFCIVCNKYRVANNTLYSTSGARWSEGELHNSASHLVRNYLFLFKYAADRQ
jgi:hypothetical protein